MAEEIKKTVEQTTDTTKATAFKDGRKVGPKESEVQIRPAGAESQANTPKKWDSVDEAADESFPASDPPSTY